jgi:hypothetical protein
MKILPSFSTQNFPKQCYNRLLYVLISLMILSPFLDRGIIGSVLMSALFFYNNHSSFLYINLEKTILKYMY